MDKYEELLFKKELAQSTQYSEIRKRLLDYMVESSKNQQPTPEVYKWWLYLLHEVDSWVAECDAAIKKAQKEKGE